MLARRRKSKPGVLSRVIACTSDCSARSWGCHCGIGDEPGQEVLGKRERVLLSSQKGDHGTSDLPKRKALLMFTHRVVIASLHSCTSAAA